MGVMDDEYFYVAKTELPPADQVRADQQADGLRKAFIKRWAVWANLDLYKTDTEKDWAYIVRMESRWMWQKSWWIGLSWSFAACAALAVVKKQANFYPLLLTPLFAGYVYYPIVDKNTKRLFDMLNIGTEYELGAERNRVLEECNRISRRADF
jgi:hypothetical protein